LSHFCKCCFFHIAIFSKFYSSFKSFYANNSHCYLISHQDEKHIKLIKYEKKEFKMQNELDLKQVCTTLNEIMEYELAGVVRYTHSALMVVGPHRIPIVSFLQEQANESLQHAQQAGELLTGLDGHPSQKIAKIVETNNHSIKDILEESLEHELHALSLYKKLLTMVEGASIYLEEYTRDLIGQEEQHQLELRKMLKDFS
jgi:bacterioferritin